MIAGMHEGIDFLTDWLRIDVGRDGRLAYSLPSDSNLWAKHLS